MLGRARTISEATFLSLMNTVVTSDYVALPARGLTVISFVNFGQIAFIRETVNV